MSIHRFILLVALCCLCANCSTGVYDKAFSRETPTRKGVRYLLGRGVERNHEKAFYYFKRAADSGDPFAENELAYLYAAGKGTARNEREALRWYQKAANHGLASAQYNLGLMYRYGLGTKMDKAVALKWIQQAADHGFLPAQTELSNISNETHPA